MFFRKKEKKKKSYSVELKGGTHILYSEGGRQARIGSEIMNDSTRVIYFRLFKSWLPPHESEVVTDEIKERVKQNIDEELQSQGLRRFEFD